MTVALRSSDGSPEERRDGGSREDRRRGGDDREAEHHAGIERVAPRQRQGRRDQERRRTDQPQAGDRKPPRLAQDAADDGKIGPREGQRDEGEDAGAEQRSRRCGEPGQRKAEEDAGHEALRAVAADEGEDVEQAVHRRP
jgi:hypothetical protein